MTQHLDAAKARIASADSAEALRAIEREYFDKGGVIAGLLAAVPGLPPEERRDAGRGANQLKNAVQAALDAERDGFAQAALAEAREGRGFDPTLPGTRTVAGGLHPVTLVTRELEDIFTSMGYQILDGPEV